MLILLRNSEVGKYDSENKYIIYWKGFFDQISCEKLEGFLFSEPVIYKDIKYKSEGDPYTRPYECFFYRYDSTFFMEYSEIECEHHKDKNIKPDPKPDVDFHKILKNKVKWFYGFTFNIQENIIFLLLSIRHRP